MFGFLEDAVHGIPRVFNRTLDPNCNSRVDATSPAQSASVITTTEPCGVLAIPGTSRLQPTTMLHAGFPIKYLSKRLMLISSGVVAVPSRREWTFCQDDPTRVTYRAIVCDVVVLIRPGCVIVIRFLETECVGSLEFAKTKVFAQLCHVVTRDSKRVALRCSAQRTTKKLLRLVGHHTPTHCHVFREFLQQILCQFTGTPPPACRPHAHQSRCPVPCLETNKDRAHLERNRVLPTCPTSVPASASEMF